MQRLAAAAGIGLAKTFNVRHYINGYYVRYPYFISCPL